MTPKHPIHELSDPFKPIDPSPPGRWRVRFEQDWATGNSALWIYKTPYSRFGDQTKHFVSALTFTEVKMDQQWGATDSLPPTMCASHEQEADNIGVKTLLQEMLDAAWAIGLRPSDFNEKDHTSELKAVRYHLEDMRTLALKGKGP